VFRPSRRACSRTLRRPKEPSNVAYRLVDGRIAERWTIRDDLTMLRQLDARTHDRVGLAGVSATARSSYQDDLKRAHDSRQMSALAVDSDDVPTRQRLWIRFACHWLPGCLVSGTRASTG
jgi:hypothetical protein